VASLDIASDCTLRPTIGRYVRLIIGVFAVSIQFVASSFLCLLKDNIMMEQLDMFKTTMEDLNY